MKHELKIDKRFKHNLAKKYPKEYAVWRGIKKRCFQKNCWAYKYYGGAGVTLFNGWIKSFDAFLSEVGPRPTNKHNIDRINNKKGYEPGNVRWADDKQSSRNRSVGIEVEINKELMTIADASKKYGIKYATLYYRYQKGLSFLSPVRGTKDFKCKR